MLSALSSYKVNVEKQAEAKEERKYAAGIEKPISFRVFLVRSLDAVCDIFAFDQNSFSRFNFD